MGGVGDEIGAVWVGEGRVDVESGGWWVEGCVRGVEEEGRKIKGMVPSRPVVLVRAWGMEREVR